MPVDDVADDLLQRSIYDDVRIGYWSIIYFPFERREAPGIGIRHVFDLQDKRKVFITHPPQEIGILRKIGFFNSFPTYQKFGFEQTPKKFTEEPTPENLIKYVKGAKNLKEVLIALINAHNNAYLSQFLIDDYELLLNKLLEA